MIKLFTAAILTLFVSKISAQKNDDVFYVFKQDWSTAADMKEATYFMHVTNENDSTYYCRYYQKLGPMVKQDCYKDAGLSIPNGRFAWYNATGRIDSTGYVFAGKKDGIWYRYYDSAKAQMAIYYEDGKRIKAIDYRNKKEYYPDGTEKVWQDDGDLVFKSHSGVEPKYPGGPQAWAKFLTGNLRMPDRLMDISTDSSFVDNVSFLINEDGEPTDMFLQKSCEYTADAEVFRLITKGGNWIPATINGNKVIYRQTQSITFSYK